MAGGVLCALCVVIAYTPAVSAMSRQFIRSDSIPAHVDAIAVLGMGITPDGMMRGETLDRLLSGLWLARHGIASAMVVSRETREHGGKIVSDSAHLDPVVATGDAPIPVVFVDSVLTTRTEAMRMRAIARSHGWNTVAVVTSPMHSRRACASFEAVGFRGVCSPALVR